MSEINSRYLCPVDDCGWHLDEPRVRPLQRDPVTGDWYGKFVSQAAVEKACGDHFSTHTVVEFLTTIRRLSDEVASLEASRDDWDPAL
jgi:hypothetical protein